MNLVVIESPFAPPKNDPEPWLTIERNVTYVRAAMRIACLEGLAPYASHALYTLPGVLNDEDPSERKLGMRAGFSWGRCAESRWVMEDFGISNGMKLGIQEAEKLGQKISRRKVYGFPERWEKSVSVFRAMKKALSKPTPPSVIVQVDESTMDELETWSKNTEGPLPKFVHDWHRNPERLLPACFKY